LLEWCRAIIKSCRADFSSNRNSSRWSWPLFIRNYKINHSICNNSQQPHPLILMIVKKIQNSEKNYLHFLDIVIWRDLNNRIFFNFISFWVWLWILQDAVFVLGSRLKICALQNLFFYSRDNFGSVTNKSVWRIVSINELIFFCQSSNKYLSSSPETITNQKSQLQIYDKCCVAWTTKNYAKKNPNSKIPKISPTETISYFDSLFVNSPSPIQMYEIHANQVPMIKISLWGRVN
jgi:hypothetical protein